MASNVSNILHFVFCVIFFYQIILVHNECMDKFSLSDEADNYVLDNYLEALENYTGLSPDFQVRIPVNCPNTGLCIINAQGSAIWQARMKFYTPYVLNSSTSETLYTCLCYSRFDDELQQCLQTVRANMLSEIKPTMLSIFRYIVERDSCASLGENCMAN